MFLTKYQHNSQNAGKFFSFKTIGAFSSSHFNTHVKLKDYTKAPIVWVNCLGRLKNSWILIERVEEYISWLFLNFLACVRAFAVVVVVLFVFICFLLSWKIKENNSLRHLQIHVEWKQKEYLPFSCFCCHMYCEMKNRKLKHWNLLQ